MRRAAVLILVLVGSLLVACADGSGSGNTDVPRGTSAGQRTRTDEYVSEYGGYGPVVGETGHRTPTPAIHSNGYSSAAQPTEGATAPPGTNVYIVRVVNFGFEPPELEIPVGTTVIWENTAPTTHTVTAKDGAFDSGLLESGERFQRTLNTPGVHEYWCTLHPEMVGRITVR